MVLQLVSILTFLLTLFYACVVLFLRNGWLKIKSFRLVKGFEPITRVSIIIAARNEELQIRKTIEDILAQDYPKSLVELIIVDDHSTDRTAEIIASYPEIKLIQLRELKSINSYKKKAISEAVGLARGELIVTTDADCRMNEKWLKTVVGSYEKNNFNMISSPVIYFDEKNRFEKMQTLEFLYLIGLGASTIGNKIPSTCNGANLAYKRAIFIEVGGFEGIDNLASGDDELLLHKIALKYPNSIGFCKSVDALVYTNAKETLRDFISQRKRWASKSTQYKSKSLIALGILIWLFNIIIVLNAILAFFYPVYLQLFIISIVIKFSVELLFLIPMCCFVNRTKLLWYLPFLTVIHTFYLIFIGIAGNFGKYEWKGRMVR